jgi:hypothetical protein
MIESILVALDYKLFEEINNEWVLIDKHSCS